MLFTIRARLFMGIFFSWSGGACGNQYLALVLAYGMHRRGMQISEAEVSLVKTQESEISEWKN